MKIEKTISLFLSFILIGAAISCKSSSSASLNDNANENRDGEQTLAATNANMKTPIPAAKDCPPESQTVSPMDLVDDRIEKYVGCTISVSGRLMDVGSDYVLLKDTVGNLQGEQTITCGGNFSSDIYSQIGHKLYDLKSKSYPDSKFPQAIFSGKVKQVEGSSTVGLTDCVLTDLIK